MMLEAIQGLVSLHWSHQKPQYRPLPDHIKRQYVSSEGGELEILICSPSIADSTSPALFFVHGGYGSAGVWLEWMTYLHEADYGGTMYAYSARNHGASYTISFLKMVYGTSLNDMAADLKTCYDFAEIQNSTQDGRSNIILVSHSAGGGLTQYAPANSLVRCRALCLVDAVPHLGMLPVYWNWACADPFFLLRSLFHLQHPSSPLSTSKLVHGRFFGSQFPLSRVPSSMKWMPAYESMGWPIGQMGRLWAWLQGRPQWLDIRRIVRNISGARTAKQKDAVCVMVGSQDVLMDVGMCQQSTAEYRNALRSEIDSKAFEAAHGADSSISNPIDGTTLESAGGVRLIVVEGASHHLQNDVQRDVGAKALLQFVQQC